MDLSENIAHKYTLQWLHHKNTQRTRLHTPHKALVLILVPRLNGLPPSTIYSFQELWDVFLVNMGNMGKLNLPGGDIGHGLKKENPFDAACRELEEETLGIFDGTSNISNVDMKNFGVDFYYTVSGIHYPVRVFVATVSYNIRENLNYINDLYKKYPNGETFGIKLISLTDLISYVRRRKNKTIKQTSFTQGKFKKDKIANRVLEAIRAIFPET